MYNRTELLHKGEGWCVGEAKRVAKNTSSESLSPFHRYHTGTSSAASPRHHFAGVPPYACPAAASL